MNLGYPKGKLKGVLKMDYKDKITIIIVVVAGVLLWYSYNSGYQAALEDVRYGNVKVICEVCPRGY